MDNYQEKSQEERWQEAEDERLEYEGYCRKISQGLESQSETSGIRAIWELVQNARDLSDHAVIKIELTPQSLMFSHHGTPFDYTSFRALVKQDSSKDRADADTVGQYGTGFMTTHTFNRLVYVSAPFAVKRSKDDICGYIQINDFELDRRMVDKPEGPSLMKNQLEEVRKFWKRPRLESMADDRTTFRYDLEGEQVEQVSSYLESVVRLVPFVLILNETIEEIEVEDKYSNKHYSIRKIETMLPKNLAQEGWAEMTETISMKNCLTGKEETVICRSLKSDKGDVVIIPPYPELCGNMKNIPSLFLWFPLLGTDSFGVNFIFHSKRFYPVEKRNNIMLPGASQISKEKGVENEKVLKEMMAVVFEYYKDEGHAKELNLDMCRIAFPAACENEETERFYKEMQEIWNSQVPSWKVLPIGDTLHSIDEKSVKLLHPSFYNELDEEQRRKYEPVIAHYVSLVKNADGSDILIPTQNLIEWSEVVNRWNCGRDSEFFVTVADVCRAIKDSSDELFSFLMLLKDSGNSKMMEEYPLLPNRKGQLRKRGDLYYGAFMDDAVYSLVCTVMGDDAAKMYDPRYIEVSDVNAYTESDLQKAITVTITSWRNQILNTNGTLSDEQLEDLIQFCSATALDDFKNQRGKMMRVLPEFYDKAFSQVATIKYRSDDEEEFYKPAFNLLLDYTLSQVRLKDAAWVVEHKEWLLRFLQEYAPNENEDKKKKLDTYGVLPNQNAALCLKSSLKANKGVPKEMVEIYKAVFNKDLKDEWIDPEFENLIELPIVTPKAVAQTIETSIVDDMKLDTHHFEKVVRRIILKVGESKDWQDWFGTIDDKKATYTFSMQSGRAQKSLFSLMDNCSDDNLEQLAKYGKNIEGLLNKLSTLEKQERDSAARFNHLHTIGKHIEDVLRERIGKDVVSIAMPKDKEDDVDVDDVQDGQDIVVKVQKDGNWKNIFYVEVKSKWDFNEAAHMSMRQVRMASLNPDDYALCCVDLRQHKDKDLANLPETIILAATKVKLDIGKTLFPMMSGILSTDKQPDETVIKISEYRSNIPAKVFEVGEPFEKLLEKIEAKAKAALV